MSNATGVTIRAPQPQDRAVWAELWRRYLEFYQTRVPDEVYDWTWAQISTGADEMHGRLAFVDGAAVGLVHFLYHRTFWGPEPRCYLNDLFTTPEARGRGIGQRLIETVYAHATDAGASQVYWLTAEDNLQARALYDRVAQKTPFIKYMEPK